MPIKYPLPVGLLFILLWAGSLNPVAGQAYQAGVTTTLRNTLVQAAVTAVQRLGTSGGYLNNKLVHIGFPTEAKEAHQLLERFGGEEAKKLMEKLVVEMNTAAEAAARDPRTRQTFIDAITSLTIQDGLTILKGDSTDATSYLRTHTEPTLQVVFKPLIQQYMAQAHVQTTWAELTRTYNGLAGFFHHPPIPEDLSLYITQQALAGLFLVVGQEEAKLRHTTGSEIATQLHKLLGK